MPDTVRRLFHQLQQDHPGVFLEDKVFALALHYRMAPEARGLMVIYHNGWLRSQQPQNAGGDAAKTPPAQ